MASVADDAARPPRDAATVELQKRVASLAGLFAEAVKGTSKAVESAVDEAYSKGGGRGGDAAAPRVRVEDLNPINQSRLDLTAAVNGEIGKIRALVESLPGINSTTEQLLQQLHEEEERNKKAGEDLLAAQAEAKRWLEFIEEAEKKNSDRQ